MKCFKPFLKMASTWLLLILLGCSSPSTEKTSAPVRPQPTPQAAPTASESPALPYPLDTCLVSAEPLGSMGEPYTFIREQQTIKLCCKGCLKKFEKDPGPYLAVLTSAKK